ncbi:anhydro-N-acetylmuramic acid kinase [Cognatishimia sp. MH4019]|uniref:anhydro-N-acetylmuramic acid kinase n=1 Tax=Cognatishimia sp. MH4019 TaxID=2854030 RepID=UPI001CD60087|nr:anhydro-N-acetylmuramic acid kinase [Cognatishimia sp. MH4019]
MRAFGAGPLRALGAGPIRALGAMSGTSLDGVDAAVVVTDGQTIEAFGAHEFRAYTEIEQAQLRRALGQWPSEALDSVQELVEMAHAHVLSRFDSVDLVGFHGQTLAHDPANRRTHQIGDGRVLAEVLQLPVVWDFRSNDVELGGQGAPLAPFFHHACARWAGLEQPVGFLNLGGVGNLTWVDPRLETPDEDGALLAFDTGPANAPINDLMQTRRGQAYDSEGALAAAGQVNMPVLERFLSHGYFHKIPPKSLDRDDFSDLPAEVSDLGDADAAATLTACAAASVAQGMVYCPSPPTRLFVTGGGRRNPTLMAMLRAGLDCPVEPVEALGLNGDMLEAQAFAYLAVRVLRGLPTSAPGTTGVRAPVGGGTLSNPSDAQQSFTGVAVDEK